MAWRARGPWRRLTMPGMLDSPERGNHEPRGETETAGGEDINYIDYSGDLFVVVGGAVWRGGGGLAKIV